MKKSNRDNLFEEFQPMISAKELEQIVHRLASEIVRGRQHVSEIEGKKMKLVGINLDQHSELSCVTFEEVDTRTFRNYLFFNKANDEKQLFAYKLQFDFEEVDLTYFERF